LATFNHGDGVSFDGSYGVLAHAAAFHPPDGRVHFVCQ